MPEALGMMVDCPPESEVVELPLDELARTPLDHPSPLLVDAGPDLLPTHELSPEVFQNRLALTVAREVIGLRDVHVYGVPGQSQHGIDIIGFNYRRERDSVQAKRVQTFTAGDLTRAVEKYANGALPFTISTLYVAVGCLAEDTEVIAELVRLNEAHCEFQIELWDQRRISDALRSRRDIVVDVFGELVADVFCLPSRVNVVSAPQRDRAQVADAAMRDPVTSTGASGHLTAADRLEPSNPVGAAQEVQLAQQQLADAGFIGHANALMPRWAMLMINGGQGVDAAEELSARFWAAMDSYDLGIAERMESLLAKVSDETTSDRPATPRPPHLLAAAAAAAHDVIKDALGPIRVDLGPFVDADMPTETARLAVLAAEYDAIDSPTSSTWATKNLLTLRNLTTVVDTQNGGDDAELLACLLRIIVAESTGQWDELVGQALRTKLPRNLCALILARHAAYQADNGDLDSADEDWLAATNQACLHGNNEDAAEWVMSRFRARARNSRSEDLLKLGHLATSLRAIGGAELQTTIRRARESATSSHHEPPKAVSALRAYHRFTKAAGSWEQLRDARRLLGDAYQAAGEHERAIALYIVAGDPKRAENVADATGDHYIDVRLYMGCTAYWISATAMRFAAAQADLIPDAHVADVAARAVSVLNRQQSGTLTDTTVFDPSLYLSAHTLLASIASRLPRDQAETVLHHLRTRIDLARKERRTDADYVRVCVGIANTHPDLADDAIDQLLHLLADGDSVAAELVEREASQLFVDNASQVRARLAEMVDQNNRPAARLLFDITSTPNAAQLSIARNAAAELRAPLTSTEHNFGIGTGAGRQANLASHLPASERALLVAAQLERAQAPYEPSLNRAEYLGAACSMAHNLADADAQFRQAITLANDGSPSSADVEMLRHDHPLGMIHVTGMIIDTRPHAVHLAAILANTSEQRAEARNTALRLVNATEGWASWHVARAFELTEIDGSSVHELLLLTTHNDCILRALAAWMWVNGTHHDSRIGALLANDSDAYVRRSLAAALKNDPEVAPELVEILTRDPRHSVRRFLI